MTSGRGAGSTFYLLHPVAFQLGSPMAHSTLKVLVQLSQLTLPVLVTGVRMNIANERGRPLQIRFV